MSYSPKHERIILVAGLFGVVLVGHVVVLFQQPVDRGLELGFVVVVGQSVDQFHDAGAGKVIVSFAVRVHAPQLVHRFDVVRYSLRSGDAVREEVKQLGESGPQDRRYAHAAGFVRGEENGLLGHRTPFRGGRSLRPLVDALHLPVEEWALCVRARGQAEKRQKQRKEATTTRVMMRAAFSFLSLSRP